MSTPNAQSRMSLGNYSTPSSINQDLARLGPQRSYIPIVDFLERFYIVERNDGGYELVKLNDFQKKILNHVFTPDQEGNLRFRNFIFGAPKKSAKTEGNAMIIAWYVFAYLPYSRQEIYLCSNDLQQSIMRVYRALRRAIELSPYLKGECKKIGEDTIVLKNGTIIQALANEYAGAAGANPSLSMWEEIWARSLDKDRRLWHEMTIPPTRKNAMRCVATYAGWVGESILLEEIYKNMTVDHKKVDLGLAMNYETGEMTPIHAYEDSETFLVWEHEGRMEWHTKAYYEREMNEPGFRWSEFQRIHRNNWVAPEAGMEIALWDQCVALGKEINYTRESIQSDPNMQVAVGVDASTVKDRTSIAVVSKRFGKIWLVDNKTWQPSKTEPLNFEHTIEKYLMDLSTRFFISAVYYDPWQMHSTAQRLLEKGINMVAYPQTQPSTIKMTENLLDRLNEKNIVLYPDEELRKEAMMASIREVMGRGRRFIKTETSKKIDSIIALSMAVLAGTLHLPDMSEMENQIVSIRARGR